MANSSIWLHSGKLVDVLDITKTKFDIFDFAHTLALINRYAGNTVRPYSVAEHSVKGSRLDVIRDLGLARAFLIHDASEAIVNDLPNPVKRQLPQYEAFEATVQQHIFACFNEPWENMERLHSYDRRMCQDEMGQVFTVPRDIGLEPLGVKVSFWNWKRAEAEFIERAGEVGLL